MAVTYEWTFPALNVIYNSIDEATGLPVQNVVVSVHWVYTARDGEISSAVYDETYLPPPGTPFTAYSELTPEIVQGWVETALGPAAMASMQQSLAISVAEKMAPKGGDLTPPWQM